ncbi:unnamed protein product [Sphagnum troendelagicum]|uniref:AUGMIN subunit 2 n=1 Tax=Sphagnum jensenii TaxID=128206 RepID=A0ABP0W298_9BRYO
MAWVGKRPARRLGGMADVLTMASDLGFHLPEEGSSPVEGSKGGGGKGEEALVHVLRELAAVQRNLANLQVELQGRQDDEKVAHLTHVSEIQKKSQALAKTTATLQDVIHNKDRIIARLQQPYSLDCIPVETEYQRQFSELLVKAAGDYGALSAATVDIQWSHSFKDPPAIWGELLRPIPTALAACTRYYEALSAMRDAVAALHQARVQCPPTPATTPAKDGSDHGGSECVTPPPWKAPVEEPNSDDVLIRSHRQLQMNPQDWGVTVSTTSTQSEQFLESMKPRRMSWPPSPGGAGAV